MSENKSKFLNFELLIPGIMRQVKWFTDIRPFKNPTAKHTVLNIVKFNQLKRTGLPKKVLRQFNFRHILDRLNKITTILKIFAILCKINQHFQYIIYYIYYKYIL